MFFKKFLFTLLISLLFLSGCVVKDERIYYWGKYEDIVRQSYVAPGEMDVKTQISELEIDLKEAKKSGKKVAPGFYVHLGVLYAKQGKIAKSNKMFLQEKMLFPESSVLIDGMLDRAKANQEAQ